LNPNPTRNAIPPWTDPTGLPKQKTPLGRYARLTLNRNLCAATVKQESRLVEASSRCRCPIDVRS
jgi:hypothetical protein